MVELGQVRKPLVIFVVQTIILDDLYIAFIYLAVLIWALTTTSIKTRRLKLAEKDMTRWKLDR